MYSRSFLLIGTLGVLLVFISMATVFAFVEADRGPRPWPTSEIRISNQSHYQQETEAAIGKINSAGVAPEIKLTKVNPQVIITEADSEAMAADRKCQDCVAYASAIGYHERVATIKINGDMSMASPDLENIIAHEIGHVLGLPHSKTKCQLMNADNILSDCNISGGYHRCGLQQEEIKRLQTIYYKRERDLTVAYTPWCPLVRHLSKAPPTVISQDGQEIAASSTQRNQLRVGIESNPIITASPNAAHR